MRPPKPKWLVIGGRGAGKTRLGAEWVNAMARGYGPFAEQPYVQIALIGETLSDVREVMIEGPSGIAALARADRPRFEPSRRRLVWEESGAVAHMFSSEDPESLRGPQFDAAWCDELGCPACDKGPNQPNVFHDPKSAESALPYFSSGGRSDLAQKRLLEAHLAHWGAGGEGFEERNPLSPLYGGRMVDAARIYLWAWDARPFPAFPQAVDVWADGGNWALGHWLNGRLANPSVGDLVNAILADAGLPAADVRGATGSVVGYVATEPMPPRAALDQIADVFGLAIIENEAGLVVRAETHVWGPPAEPAEFVIADDGPVRLAQREAAHQAPGVATLGFRDAARDYQAGTARYARPAEPSLREELLWFSGVLDVEAAQGLVTDWLRRRWRARETATFSVPASDRSLGTGSLVRLGPDGETHLAVEVEEGIVRRVRARRVGRIPETPRLPATAPTSVPLPQPLASPLVHFLDLPAATAGDEPATQFRIAAWARPWRPQIALASPEETGFATRTVLADAAAIGELLTALEPGASGMIDRRRSIAVRLFGGALSSISLLQLLNGGNAAAVRSASGEWEVLQFGQAVENAPDEWLLTELLRGQLGTEDAMAAGAAAGAPFVLLDDAVKPAGLRASEAGLPLNWRVGPSGSELGGTLFAAQVASGGLRAARPLSPARLSARRLAGGDLAVKWIRRGRIDADNWSADDIRLGEEAEAYRVEVRDAGGVLIHTAETTAPEWTYGAADIAVDVGAPAEIDIVVSQRKGVGGLAGIPARLRVALS